MFINKKSLLIVGAGEYGQLIQELAEDCGYEKIAFLDDNSPIAIGKISDAEKFLGVYEEIIIAIGNSDIREKVFKEMELLFRVATLIHPSAYVSRSAIISTGSIVECGAVVHTAVRLGKACIINAGAVVNHNSTVGDFSQVDCNAIVSARSAIPCGMKVMSGTVWNGSNMG